VEAGKEKKADYRQDNYQQNETWDDPLPGHGSRPDTSRILLDFGSLLDSGCSHSGYDLSKGNKNKVSLTALSVSAG
jgi:hypothetical protein